jgi:phosphoglycerate kinase
MSYPKIPDTSFGTYEGYSMPRKLSISDLQLDGKRVLIRVDFNVPLDKHGAITDDTRIVSSLPTIRYVLDHGGKAILMSHFGRPKGKQAEFSLAPCAKRLSELLGKKVVMAPDCIGVAAESLAQKMRPGDVLLLENVRFYPAEEKPELDPNFAKKLASLGDYYINDAFGSAHRAHSSTTTVASYFPDKAATGFLMEKEITFLGGALLEPKRPFYAIIGGAKISTKIGVLKSLLQKVDALFLGGGMAYTFFKAQGISIGKSICEESMLTVAQEILAEAKRKNVQLFLPVDIVAATAFENDAPSQTFDVATGIPDEYQGVDIGEKTIAKWTEELKKGKTIFWNGPVGVFEFKAFAKGTDSIAKTLAQLTDATTIVGGGDSIAALQANGCADKITHISTGGGASLEYIEQGKLPGIEALGIVRK